MSAVRLDFRVEKVAGKGQRCRANGDCNLVAAWQVLTSSGLMTFACERDLREALYGVLQVSLSREEGQL